MEGRCCLAGRMIRRRKIHSTQVACTKCDCCTGKCSKHPANDYCVWCGGPRKFQRQLSQQGLQQCYECLAWEEHRKTEALAQGFMFSDASKHPCPCGLSKIYCPCN